MAISMNTKVLFTTKANSLSGMIGNKNGNILVGDKAFEFYNNRNPEDYIQIPWGEIVRVRAQIFFKDKYIRGFFIDTKSAGSYNFVVKNAGKTLKTMRDFLGNEKIVRNKPVLSLKKVFEWFKKKQK
ncbi:MAG: DUF956 family protein [Leptotrichia hongkongensis]